MINKPADGFSSQLNGRANINPPPNHLDCSSWIDFSQELILVFF